MYEISKKTLFQFWNDSSKENLIEEIFKSIVKHFSLKFENLSSSTQKQWKTVIRDFCNKINIRWRKSGKKIDRFLVRFDKWLENGSIYFVTATTEDFLKEKAQKIVGRPPKPFEEVLYRSKKQKVEHLLKSSTEEITFAAEIALRNDGKKDAANLVKEISSAAPGRSTEIKHLCEKENAQKPRQYSKEEALAIFLDCRLTKQSYINLRKSAIKAGHELYPSYKQIQEAKIECCPPEENIFINETRAEMIDLQALLDHTAKRLVSVQESVLQQHALMMNLKVLDLILVSKYGCDGSSGHSRYKQKFQNQEVNDEYLFVYSLVPIKLNPIKNKNIFLWQNDRPSSTKLCQPIKFVFSKETSEMVSEETKKIKLQIIKLIPTVIILKNYIQINIHHELHLTMVDGKLCNILTETKSSQTCYICGATPKNMNMKPNNTQIKNENYAFGLSPLHARIRSFECLLHIGYKLNYKQWQVRGKEQQEEIKIRKQEIQKRFKNEMGLDVDKPKPGFGSSNDGNTARAFFNNPEKSSDITGVNKTLIKQLGVILDTICSGYDIDLTKFEEYCSKTTDQYLALYSWYYMPVTVHKLLFHSTDIIKHGNVPIGQLSEEAQEARHKDCRRYREHHTQKISRSATNKDLMRILLVSSDPVIAHYRQKAIRPKKTLSGDVLALLKCPELPCFTNDDSSETSEDDSEYMDTEFDGESE